MKTDSIPLIFSPPSGVYPEATIADANKRNRFEVQDGVGNTKLIDELIGQINGVVGGLDAIMFNKYTRRPEKLRACQSASHVERAPQREKKPTPAPTPIPPH